MASAVMVHIRGAPCQGDVDDEGMPRCPAWLETAETCPWAGMRSAGSRRRLSGDGSVHDLIGRGALACGGEAGAMGGQNAVCDTGKGEVVDHFGDGIADVESIEIEFDGLALVDLAIEEIDELYRVFHVRIEKGDFGACGDELDSAAKLFIDATAQALAEVAEQGATGVFVALRLHDRSGLGLRPLAVLLGLLAENGERPRGDIAGLILFEAEESGVDLEGVGEADVLVDQGNEIQGVVDVGGEELLLSHSDRELYALAGGLGQTLQGHSDTPVQVFGPVGDQAAGRQGCKICSRGRVAKRCGRALSGRARVASG